MLGSCRGSGEVYKRYGRRCMDYARRCLTCTECFFFFQAEDGIRDLVRSRGLGDVYKRQSLSCGIIRNFPSEAR